MSLRKKVIIRDMYEVDNGSYENANSLYPSPTTGKREVGVSAISFPPAGGGELLGRDGIYSWSYPG